MKAKCKTVGINLPQNSPLLKRKLNQLTLLITLLHQLNRMLIIFNYGKFTTDLITAPKLAGF